MSFYIEVGGGKREEADSRFGDAGKLSASRPSERTLEIDTLSREYLTPIPSPRPICPFLLSDTSSTSTPNLLLLLDIVHLPSSPVLFCLFPL